MRYFYNLFLNIILKQRICNLKLSNVYGWETVLSLPLLRFKIKLPKQPSILILVLNKSNVSQQISNQFRWIEVLPSKCRWSCQDLATDSSKQWHLTVKEYKLQLWVLLAQIDTLNLSQADFNLLLKWWLVEEWFPEELITLSEDQILLCNSRELKLKKLQREPASSLWEELVKSMNTEVRSLKPRTPNVSLVQWDWLLLPRLGELRKPSSKRDLSQKLSPQFYTN